MARNLLNRSFEVLGVDQKIWVALENGGFGKLATSVASGVPGLLYPDDANAIEHIKTDIKYNIPRQDSPARSGRSVVTRLSGKKEVAISWEGYIIPGTPDGSNHPTLPPIHPFLLSVFGTFDHSNPAQIVYSLSRLNGNSFRILEEATHFSRLAIGCVADNMTISLPGDGKAQIKMDGFGQDVFVAGQSTLAQALTGAPVHASKVIQDLTYTAVAAGSVGNNITIAYTTGGTAGAEVVTVVGTAISVQIATGVSTATQVAAAVTASSPAAALVSVAVSGTGSNAQTAPVAATHLAGGLLTTELLVASGEGAKFEAGAYIDVIAASDGNTVSNMASLITGVGTGVNADVLTVGSALSAASSGDFVIGHAPATYEPITSQFALLGLKGTISFAGFAPALEVVSAEISIKNNFTKKSFVYGTSAITGYLPDKRRAVGLKTKILLNRDNFAFFMQSKQFIAQNVTLTIAPQDIPAPSFSSGVGRTWTFNLPRVEFNIPPIEEPADSYVSLDLDGVALATDINTTDTELTLTIA